MGVERAVAGPGMDACDSFVCDGIFSDALALFYDFINDTERNRKYQVDDFGFYRSYGSGDALLRVDSWNVCHSVMTS